ncbi:MAG: hypothetical protein EXQ57_06165, partial [Bryobacterales bacterium]|nr:hypothetical protein [Bryobacterales bacterium]
MKMAAAVTRRPNVVIIFLDDSDWADFHPFGKPPYPTPNVERLARQGCAFHNFYVPRAICPVGPAAARARLFGSAVGGGFGLGRIDCVAFAVGEEEVLFQVVLAVVEIGVAAVGG